MAEHFDKMVDMRRSPEDRARQGLPILGDDRNHGMCITLCGEELDKLDRDTDVEPGTVLHFCCMGIVRDTAASTEEHGNRMVIEIVHMAVENENEEEGEIGEDDRAESRYGAYNEEERVRMAANIGLPTRKSVPREPVT